MNTPPFGIGSDLDVKYGVRHPQRCGQGGNAVPAEVFKSTDPDTYLLVGACAPETRVGLFKRIMRTTGFDEPDAIEHEERIETGKEA